jgi:flagellar biosynthesis/type III secretory pathway chaperone
MTTIDWEAEIIALLDELSQVQDELFSTLKAKRDCMSRSDMEGMTALEEREELVRKRLEECHHRRQQLLRAARQRSLPSESLGKLATAATVGGQESLANRVKETSARIRLLQHESLTNWVLAQRSLLHYAQLLEILATGGRPQPTYKEKGAAAPCAGVLVNQEA